MLPQAVKRLATISGAASVRLAAEIMSRPHTDLLVVCGEGGSATGVLTKTDIVAHISQLGGAGSAAQVDTIMTAALISCRVEDRLEDVWASMKKTGLQRVPVLDIEHRPIGIVYARDALQCMLGAVESDEALLKDYVMSVGYR